MLYKRGKCDFMWEYGSRAHWSNTRFGGGATGGTNAYDVADDESAIELWAPWIGSLFHPDYAICFFWLVWPKIELGLEFIRACGFKPSTLAFDWVKTCKNDDSKFKPGPGFWTGSNSEICVLGYRGSIKPNKALVGQVNETFYTDFPYPITVKHPHIYGPTGKIIHSRKPDIFKQKIDLMYPAEIYGQGIGLFEREPQGPGWDVFGDQVEGSIPGPDFQQIRLSLFHPVGHGVTEDP
jgi:N6-adenosine-specific RNA methylase IME4